MCNILSEGKENLYFLLENPDLMHYILLHLVTVTSLLTGESNSCFPSLSFS